MMVGNDRAVEFRTPNQQKWQSLHFVDDKAAGGVECSVCVSVCVCY